MQYSRKIDLISPKSILISRRAGEAYEEPFFYFEIENYLPAGLYQGLVEAFPESRYFKPVSYGGKFACSSVRDPEIFQSILQEVPIWGEFIGLFAHPSFQRDLFSFLRKPLMKSRGLRGGKIYREHRRKPIFPSFVNEFLYQPYSVEFEFSRLGNQTELDPHSDSRRKLVSFILHFSDENWKPEYGGETHFFRLKTEEAKSRWGNWNVNHIPPAEREDFLSQSEIAYSAPYVPNRLICFLRDSVSFHSFGKINAPEGMTRNSVIFNIMANRWA